LIWKAFCEYRPYLLLLTLKKLFKKGVRMNALVFGALKGAMKDELGQIDWLIAKVAATLATGSAYTPPILRL
jgi:hypothetical protein